MSWSRRKKPQTNPFLTFALPTFQATGGYTVPGYRVPEPEPPKIKDNGLAIEPIVGIRAFQVDLDSGSPVLHSFNGVPWHPRVPLQAYCGLDYLADHDAPGEHCQCGIYAWNFDNAERCSTNQLVGEVYLWGDVLIGEYGYRAESAYPKSLTINGEGKTRLARRIRDGLEEAYGIPVSFVEPPAPDPPMLPEGWRFERI